MKVKAGAIVYFKSEEATEILLMIPSNADFGGTKLQISKGNVDEGENTEEAAIREAEEEIGLKKSNIKKIKKYLTVQIQGYTEKYEMVLYLIEVTDKNDFGNPHFETKETAWITKNEISKTRQSQSDIITKAFNAIEKMNEFLSPDEFKNLYFI